MKLLWVHAVLNYGFSIRFEELLSTLHDASSLHHYNPNSLKLVSLSTHSKKHAFKAYQRLVYEARLHNLAIVT
ncbi:MAG TPA: hypothetical protein VFW11_01610 [Cyclobacteriaceae bacterium]|nr:hypothetical protein [Cyclobacteriaceae bacterium]